MPSFEPTLDAPPATTPPAPTGTAVDAAAPDMTAVAKEAPGHRWPTAEDLDEAIDLLHAQMRIAVRRAVHAFLLDHQRDPLALEVAADAVGGELNRRLRDVLLEQYGEQTLASLLAHREPPVLITSMLARMRAALRDRLAQARETACRPQAGRDRLAACH
jgi:hypothetical protein